MWRCMSASGAPARVEAAGRIEQQPARSAIWAATGSGETRGLRLVSPHGADADAGDELAIELAVDVSGIVW